MLNLREFDFTTAASIVAAHRPRLRTGPGAGAGRRDDRGARRRPGDRIAFLSQLESLQVAPGVASAKVIVNARTGTVVMGGQVTVLPAAVAHGSLTVSIVENLQTSQPGPFSGGVTTVTPQSTIEATQDGSRMFLFAGRHLAGGHRPRRQCGGRGARRHRRDPGSAQARRLAARRARGDLTVAHPLH